MGSYGAGLCEHLQSTGVRVVEVERPRRRDRRTGKSDRIDALLAAKKVLRARGSLHLVRARSERLCKHCWSLTARV
jgi:transposase